MKIGFFSESLADQAALAVFAEGILGEQSEPISMDLQAHGVSGVFGALDGVFRGLHYNSDAEGLVVVVDCDNTEPHVGAHDEPDGCAADCRLCQLRAIIERARRHLKPRPGRPPLKVAIGLAVPAIEAWYLVGKEHLVGEAEWISLSAAGKPPFTRPQLKKLVYGTDRPSLELETDCARREAQRIIAVMKKGEVEIAFPAGFGLMAREIRSWLPPLPTPSQ